MPDKDDLRIRFMNMDAPTAGILYDQLVSAIGKDSLQRMFSKAIDSSVDIDRESIVRIAERIGDMDEESFFRMANDHTYGYEDPGDTADDLMWDALECEFKDDISKLLESGRHADIKEYVDAVIEGLSKADGILVEYSPDTADCMISTLRQCLKEGRIMDAFEGRGWYRPFRYPQDAQVPHVPGYGQGNPVHEYGGLLRPVF